MFNHEKFFALVSAALTNPEQTWISYRDSQPTINEILLGLIIPLVVGTTVAAALLAYVFGTQDMFILGAGRSFVAMLQQMVFGSIIGVLGALAAAGVILIVARLFNATGSYSAALATVGLAAVPAMLASIPGTLPWLGWLIQFVAAIYSLVLLYKAIPVFLTIESGRRPLHFIVSIVAMLLVNVLLSLTLFGGRTTGFTPTAYDTPSTGSGGAIAGFGNAAALYEAAGNDQYQAPRNGEITRDQVRDFIRAAENTAVRRSAYLREASQIDEQRSDADDGSLRSLIRAAGSMSRGLNAGMGLLNAEMEAVKAAGGNWAEHVWVRDRLQSARYGFDDEAPGEQANRALYAREQAAIDRAFELLASMEE